MEGGQWVQPSVFVDGTRESLGKMSTIQQAQVLKGSRRWDHGNLRSGSMRTRQQVGKKWAEFHLSFLSLCVGSVWSLNSPEVGAKQ